MPSVANGLHVDARAVKRDGTTRNRTSSGANGDWAGSTRSNQAANRGFFQNRLPPDGPRWPEAAVRLLPADFVHALGSGMTDGDDAPCPCRLPDTAGPPAAVTKAVPPGRKLRYSTAREDEGEKTTSRTPSEDKSAHGNGRELVAASKSNHAEQRPRERQLPQVKSRQRSSLLRSGTPFNHLPPAYRPSVQLNHSSTPLPPNPAVACPPGSTSPRSACARPGAPAPRNWYPF